MDQTDVTAVAVGAFVLLSCLWLWQIVGSRDASFASRPQRRWRPNSTRFPRPVAALQLAHVERAGFTSRPLLSSREARVLRAAESAIGQQSLPWRVMAQVCLGEILSSENRNAFGAINSKRVDALIVDQQWHPIAAIEFQGEGHYLGNAASRDAVKREALRKAGIRYIEVTPEHAPRDLGREIARIAELRSGREVLSAALT